MVGIIDYGMGNLLSVFHAVEHIGFDAQYCKTPEDLAECDHLILPGVGAFGDCMHHLRASGMIEALHAEVRQKAKPILGICLGMQAMAQQSEEGGLHAGLGWFDALVTRLTPKDEALRVPQIGWNSVEFAGSHPVCRGIPRGADFYFVHSFWAKCSQPDQVLGLCDYGGPVSAALARENIVATQFHPEKSQEHGLKLLENFLLWRP
jgi:imidazole glycerol-phosphate synthase subunit HisH